MPGGFSSLSFSLNSNGSSVHTLEEGVDILLGSSEKDVLVFTSQSTGDVNQQQADVIKQFDSSLDKIYIPQDLTYGGATSTPAEGTYSVWQKDDDHIVTWKDEDGWNDIVVEGDNPLNAIVAGSFDWLSS